MPKTLLQERLRQSEGKPDDPSRSDVGEQENIVSGPLRFYPSAHTEKQEKKEEKKPEYNRYEDEMRMIREDEKDQLEKLRREKRKYLIERIFQVVLIVSCVYLVFLIYGAVNTSYTYNTKGEVVPLVVDVDTIRSQNEFKSVSTQYFQARTLYEEVLSLDYRLGMAGKTGEDPLLIAPEYEKILEKVTKLSVQMNALTVPARYTQPFNMLLSWVQDDLALYCQYISRAITQNNSADMNQALYYKDSMYNKFRQITQVLATLGSTVERSNVEMINEWSPEGYIEKISGGVNLETK